MHKPVLLHESVDGLDLREGKVFVDATYGAGGHTKEVLRRFPKIKAISIDQDPETQANIIGNFRDLDKLLGEVRPDAILLDLGFSSDQLESSGRGLSFQKDEPLDMRLSGSPLDKLGASSLTAALILNSWDESAIELILRGFGEEKYSRRIASAIAKRREMKPFETTFDLVEVVESSIPRFAKATQGKHPATRTFQALRIAVNEELTALEEGLKKGFDALAPGGRLAVISFHSLEDRIVKNFFREKVKDGQAKFATKPARQSGSGKPIIPSQKEVRENPRARSAKLRIVEKIQESKKQIYEQKNIQS